MPCSDNREDTDKQNTIRAACEMAKIIRAAKLFKKLSAVSRAWVLDHEKWDAACGVQGHK